MTLAPVDDVLRLEPLGEIDERAVRDRDEDRIARATRVGARESGRRARGGGGAGTGGSARPGATNGVSSRSGWTCSPARRRASDAVGGGGVVVSGEKQDGDRGEGGERVAGALERVLTDGVVVEHVSRDDDGVHRALLGELGEPAHDLEALEARDRPGVPRDERELQPELPVGGVEEAKPRRQRGSSSVVVHYDARGLAQPGSAPSPAPRGDQRNSQRYATGSAARTSKPLLPGTSNVVPAG